MARTKKIESKDSERSRKLRLQLDSPVVGKNISTSNESDEESVLHLVVKNYLESLRNIFETSKVVLPHLATWLRDEIKRTEDKIDAFIPTEASSAVDLDFDNARDFVEFTAALAKHERLTQDKSVPLLARSLFMQVFCVFDAFIGNLLKQIYLKNFDLLKGISREISLVDLLEFKDIESASRAMLEKEVDSFRRDSYIEQFSQLEKKFGLSLKKFEEWPRFVEMSQRRNLLTHNDGIVSEQYIAVCKREGCSLPAEIVPGFQLRVSPQDLGILLRVMSKVGFMLSHTLWSKVFPHEISKVHESMNSILYQALEDKRWSTASDLGDFSLTDAMKRDITDVDLRVRLINTAIAKKFAGDSAAAQKLTESMDWSASYRDFKLALLVLGEEYEKAITLMRGIGKSGELLDQTAYHVWPLFERFREREDFYTAYEEIYGEAYKAEPSETLAAKMTSKKKVAPKKKVAKKPSVKK